VAAVDQLLHRDFLVDVQKLHHLDRVKIVDAEPRQLETQHVEVAAVHALDQPRQERIGVVGGIRGRCAVGRAGSGGSVARSRDGGRHRLSAGLARGSFGA
jgi:hypothetical protein